MIHSLKNLKVPNYLATMDPVCFTVVFILYQKAAYAQCTVIFSLLSYTYKTETYICNIKIELYVVYSSFWFVAVKCVLFSL